MRMLHASFVGKKGHSVPECSWRYDLSYFCEESWHSCAQNQHLHAFVATSSTSKDGAQNDDSGASDHINADLLDMHVNTEYQGKGTLSVGDGNSLFISRISSSVFSYHVKIIPFVLRNLHCFPSIAKIVISLSNFLLDYNLIGKLGLDSQHLRWHLGP